MTPHINAPAGAFADVVLMPGDPLRAKYIAETFLQEVREVTGPLVRGPSLPGGRDHRPSRPQPAGAVELGRLPVRRVNGARPGSGGAVL